MKKERTEELRGLAEMPRYREIFTYLTSQKKHVCISDVAKCLSTTNNVASKHLHNMEKAKIVVIQTSLNSVYKITIASTEEAEKFENMIKKYS